MKREEVKEVFKQLNFAYSQFSVTPEKVDAWHKLLQDQNPARVMVNAERYILDNKFPPALADIRERRTEAQEDDFLDKLKKWEEEAVGYKP
ncbi:replicative helicase loader/inhibitor [Virgibacillus litoralis]|uniref:Transketolase n=1 Tax=Virgibacillus litoralis TaxID=578221 RepID=A0ABS4HGK5_9BACI|nr:transketolase [Virgibacillus litoralis]